MSKIWNTQDINEKLQGQTPFLWAIGAILVLFLLANSFVIVNAGERGVITHFGDVQEDVLDEGIHLIRPIMTKVRIMTVKIQKNDIETESSSKDLQNVFTHVVVNWSLDPDKVNEAYQEIGTEDVIINNIIQPAVNEVFKAAGAKKTAEEIISKRNELTEDASAMLKERLTRYHVIVHDISLVNVSFSEEFSKAIEEKQVAEQEAKKYQYIAQRAEQESAAKINIARGNAESEIIEARGKAEAQKLLQQTLTPGILQKIAIDKWNGAFPQVMSSTGALPFINLDQGKK